MIAEIAQAGWKTDKPGVLVVFFVFWTALAIGSFLFFQFNRDAKLKRRAWPVVVIGSGVIFGSFVIYFTGGDARMLFIMIPAIILISFLNLRRTRFCDSCGRTLHCQPVFSRLQFCPHCGAQLNENGAA